ncbi:MAG: acyl-CoA reductase [Chitinophagaceae bacterium]|nr:acyl-CoA reductase [Chitinophagaceae bacterium]
MILSSRIEVLSELGKYMLSDNPSWQEAKVKAGHENGWFIPEFVDLATKNIAASFLRKDVLEKWAAAYQIPVENSHPKTIGIIMAGNIPLVGFHDLLCVFITGNKAMVKPSSKDDTLMRHLVDKMGKWDEEVRTLISFSEMLKNCDAYIATGSNNSAGYFEYYFKKHPHIIRRNRTSVAVLTGNETKEDLVKLADDVYLYFGLGCRNVTKIYVPKEYDFIPLLSAFEKYNYLADNHKYKNNYDYNLAIHILNKKLYMGNPSILLVEESSPFSPVSQLHYEFYDDGEKLAADLKQNDSIQCITGKGFLPFGEAQYPCIDEYADGVDTLKFLIGL